MHERMKIRVIIFSLNILYPVFALQYRENGFRRQILNLLILKAVETHGHTPTTKTLIVSHLR